MPDRLTRIFRTILRVGIVLNIVGAVLLAVALVASIIFYTPITAQLVTKYGSSVDLALVIGGMRTLLVIGIGAAVAIDRIFRSLLAMVDSLIGGDPFVADNARRLQAIGWSLLAIQLLDLVMGCVTWMFVSLRIDVLDWVPSFTGWLGVLIAFVLARVFASGTAMRDELEATV